MSPPSPCSSATSAASVADINSYCSLSGARLASALWSASTRACLQHRTRTHANVSQARRCGRQWRPWLGGVAGAWQHWLLHCWCLTGQQPAPHASAPPLQGLSPQAARLIPAIHACSVALGLPCTACNPRICRLPQEKLATSAGQKWKPAPIVRQTITAPAPSALRGGQGLSSAIGAAFGATAPRMAQLLKQLNPAISQYKDRRFCGTQQEFEECLHTSTTVYVGNLSFFTTEDQIFEVRRQRRSGRSGRAATGGGGGGGGGPQCCSLATGALLPAVSARIAGSQHCCLHTRNAQTLNLPPSWCFPP